MACEIDSVKSELDVRLSENAHDPLFESFFPPPLRDAYHEALVHSAISSHWYSVLITDGERAFHSAFAPREIPGSELYDIEPFHGYCGPLTTTDDQHFLAEALDAYSGVCRDLNVVAELIRFDPLLRNHEPFANSSRIRVERAKAIVIAECPADEDAMIGSFSKPCRRDLRRGRRDFSFRALSDSTELRTLYDVAARRMGIANDLKLDRHFFDGVDASPFFTAYGVFDSSRLVSSALALHHPAGSHYVLAASCEDYPVGSSELMIFGIARESARRGIQKLMLGGGIGSRGDDSLLWFKRKFARANADFYIGKLVHDEKAYERLCAAAPGNSPYFLRYRYAGAAANAI